MHSLSGLTPTAASAYLPALPLPDSKIDLLFIHSAGKHSHTLFLCWGKHTTPCSMEVLLQAALCAASPKTHVESWECIFPHKGAGELFLTCTDIRNISYWLKIAKSSSALMFMCFSGCITQCGCAVVKPAVGIITFKLFTLQGYILQGDVCLHTSSIMCFL